MLLWLGLAVRAALLVFGTWQDAHAQVKYTDIDYEVITDGAAFMDRGGSPFERSTYRYTPLLAGALLPNIALHKSFGKILFSAADLLAAWWVPPRVRRAQLPTAAVCRLLCASPYPLCRQLRD